MKFYVIEIATGDAKIAGKSMYEYDSESLAVANFHSKLGTAMKSDLYLSELIMVINENGFAVKQEKWVKPIAEGNDVNG